MMYAPHILQVKVVTPLQEDEFGHPIPNTGWCELEDVVQMSL